MKTKITLLILFLATTVFAQESKLDNALIKNLNQLRDAKSNEELQASVNAFERIADAEKEQWLPQYYAAYSNLLLAMRQETNAKKDEMYDRALSYIEKAESIDKANSEICVIKSWAIGMKISIDPMNRGQKLGPESGMLIGKAMELNPENPRAYFMKGQSAMYTPEQYGGGKAIAIKYLEMAVLKYKSFKPSGPAMPNWGEQQANEALEKCRQM